MDPLTIALLAMQAAGMVTDWFGTKQQVALSRMGTKIEQAGIESNIAQNTLNYEEESLGAMKQLRQNLGSQAAWLAAHGVRGNAGSALSVTTKSISNANADERMRRMNMLSRDAQLKAGKTMSQLHQSGTEQDIWNSFARRSLNTIGVTSYLTGGGKTGSPGGGGKSVTGTALSSQAGKSFGLTHS